MASYEQMAKTRLEKAQTQLRVNLSKFNESLATADIDQQKDCAEALKYSLMSLFEIVTESHSPKWLLAMRGTLVRHADDYANADRIGFAARNSIINTVQKFGNEASAHRWDNIQNHQSYSWLYETYRDQHNLESAIDQTIAMV